MLRIKYWFWSGLSVAYVGALVLALIIFVTWRSDPVIRFCFVAIGVVAAIEWIHRNYMYYVSGPVAHWKSDQRYAVLLLNQGFDFDHVVRAILTERIAPKILFGLGLVFKNIYGEEVPPSLVRLVLTDLRGPTFMVPVPVELTVKKFADKLDALEAGFGCPIEVSYYIDPFSVQLQFCLRDSVDSAACIPETSSLHCRFCEFVALSRRFVFQCRLPLLLARSEKEVINEQG
ncbi:MAG: hypothetical protein ACYCPT_11330 [Acidimicrobiales bacterium]